jgi:hypothetical protein
MQLGRVQMNRAQDLSVTAPRGMLRRFREALLSLAPFRAIGVRHAHVVERGRAQKIIVHAAVALEGRAVRSERDVGLAANVGHGREILLDHCGESLIPDAHGQLAAARVQRFRFVHVALRLFQHGDHVERGSDVHGEAMLFRYGQAFVIRMPGQLAVAAQTVHTSDPAQHFSGPNGIRGFAGLIECALIKLE